MKSGYFNSDRSCNLKIWDSIMKLFEQVTGQSPEFTLTRTATTVDVFFNYDLSGWYDEEAGFFVYSGEAIINVGDVDRMVYQ